MSKPKVSSDVLRGVFASGGADGCKNLLRFVREGLQKNCFSAEQISVKDLALVTGAIDPFNEVDSFRESCAQARNTEYVDPQKLFTESNPGLYSNAFQVVTTELISSQIIASYNDQMNLIGDQLMETVRATTRNQKMAGFTSVAGPIEVAENHPYSESGFGEKYVTTAETKKGRILSLSEELILFDQTGEIMRRARMLGEQLRLEKERTQIRAVIDADSGSGRYVYRPSGSGESLYNADGSNKNYIGVGNTTDSGFATAVVLNDFSDFETVFKYRATAIKDDRVDGTPQPLYNLNMGCVVLVPETLRWTTAHVLDATELQNNTDTAAKETRFGNGMIRSLVGGIYASPFVDEVNTADWYFGNFRKQFVWTEIWPVQTFMQGADSEAMFERDVSMRIKVRYFGGCSATDSIYVTKVDGA